MAHQHPPLDFPLVGLDASWRGPRWLDFLEGQAGKPVVGAWLGHGDDYERPTTGSWAFVGTFSRKHVDADWRGPSRSFEEFLASTAAMFLQGDASSPEVAPEWELWDATTVSLGARTLSARIFEHAGAQVLLSFDLPGLGLLVRSRGLRADGLALAEVADYRSYHFDPTVPLAYPVVLLDSVEAALGIRPG